MVRIEGLVSSNSQCNIYSISKEEEKEDKQKVIQAL